MENPGLGLGPPSRQIECDKSSDVDLICIAIKIGLQNGEMRTNVIEGTKGNFIKSNCVCSLLLFFFSNLQRKTIELY